DPIAELELGLPQRHRLRERDARYEQRTQHDVNPHGLAWGKPRAGVRARDLSELVRWCRREWRSACPALAVRSRRWRHATGTTAGDSVRRTDRRGRTAASRHARTGR